MTLPWPWNRDDRPRGWYLDGYRTRFGPMPVQMLSVPLHSRHGQRGFLPRAVAEHRPEAETAQESAPAPQHCAAVEPAAPPKPPPAPEQRAAAALLTETQQAEARRHFKPPIDPWRERRH